MKFKYLFGPVPSRRLGISLGIDVLPYKTCTFDCVYCECGETTDLTISRKEFFPLKDIISELNDFLGSNPELDYITFAGSGEPLLYSEIEGIILHLKENFPQYKVAVITNGYLLKDKENRSRIYQADLIMPSLDAISEEVFHKINRPFPGIKAAELVNGLIELRKEYKGKIWLEVFIVPGLNDNRDEILLLREAIVKINPDSVQINTLDRPGTEDWVLPLGEKELLDISSYLWEGNAQILENYIDRRSVKSYDSDIEDKIVSTVKRRPCTGQDLSSSLGINLVEINKYIQSLMDREKIISVKKSRGTFFMIP